VRAAILYAAMTLYLAFPLSVRPASRVMSPSPDTNLFMWTLAWDVHALTHQPLRLFDANIYHPERQTLAYSENLIGSALFAAPVLWMTGNMVLAMNVVSLLSAVLCGVGAYVLARRLGVSTAGALLTGLIFGFSPARFFRLEQLHLTTIQWVPFGLASAHAYIDGRRRRDLHWTIFFFTLQALTSGHGAIFLLLSLLTLAAYTVARAPSFEPPHRRPPGVLAFLRDVGVVGALLLLPVVLMVIPYLTVQREMGLRRTLDGWASSWASFGASPSYVHSWIQSHLGLRFNESADAYLFPGYVPIVLAVSAFFAASQADARDGGGMRGGIRTFYLVLTLLSVWLALGPPLGIWPLVYWLPGMNFIRVPSRFILLAVLALAVLAGLGFDRLTRAMRARGRALAAMAVVVLAVAEFVSPLETEAYRVDPPLIDRWLATQPTPFVVAEVPLANPRNLGSAERRHTTYMLHSTAHWQKTVEGYSGLRPARHVELYEQLATFPDEQSLHALRAAGVTHLVVHTDYYGAEEWAAVAARLAAQAQWLTLLHTEGEGRVYLLHR
jgi:hypothetical protein